MVWYFPLFLTYSAGALAHSSTQNNESIWNLLPKPGVCGLSLSDRIRGGENTAINAHPWAALLYVKLSNGKPEYSCGGSLISDRFVLSVAHCFNRILKDKEKFMVRLGEWDTASEIDCVDGYCADKPIDYDIDIIKKHEDYNGGGTNDLVLLKLSKQVNFTEFITPVCLPLAEELQSPRSETGRIFTFVGWGETRIKKEVDMIGIDWDTCYKSFPKLLDQELCAGNSAKKHPIHGDSGGGLTIVEKDGFWYHYGVISFFFKLEKHVFMRTVSYLPWIAENMIKMNSDGL